MGNILGNILRMLLFLGLDSLAFVLADSMANSKNPKVSEAAWLAQSELTKRGFHECPECGWAMRRPNEHVESGVGWCYEQANYNPGVSWEEESDPALQYEKMQDRLRHQF